MNIAYLINFIGKKLKNKAIDYKVNTEELSDLNVLRELNLRASEEAKCILESIHLFVSNGTSSFKDACCKDNKVSLTKGVSNRALKVANYLIEQNLDNFVIFCVGTPKLVGDSLGPMIGTKLNNLENFGVPIYGTLDSPIHALNLKVRLEEIQKIHRGKKIIAIDASVGTPLLMGGIYIENKPLMTGKGLNKVLPLVGDYVIKGCIGLYEYDVAVTISNLNTSVSFVEEMADTITKGIAGYLSFLKYGYVKESYWK
ncbi:spore protease YyaC [Clostridium sp. CF012]|uniref:spore protease YyaC n=1 Tax=Clostridium sp. CF012 TaxID=2843319 RepID=UPI001C0B2A8E|nr:spore protease YyaC [Clostridium sp. CF012]MBU3145386.1 spore protease YyaC [Clostridium sp. CF012]